MMEVFCRSYFHQCDLIENQVIHICKETCYIFLYSCQEIIKLISYSYYKRVNPERWRNNAHRNVSEFVHCNYLPSVDDPVTCYYQPVTCPPPPDVTNGRIINGSEHNETYPVKFQVEYVCVHESLQMERNSTVTCLYGGFWSETPRCSSFPDSSSTNPLLFVLPILIIPLCLWIMLWLLIWSRKGKSGYVHYRNKEYDAFVCYDIADAEYAHETIIDELEKKSDPPFKLCIHKRDFKPSYTIKWNI